MNFNDLHKTEKPLVIANVWDAMSAKLAEKTGFKAVGTSSAAVAYMLGYEDGEEISLEEMLYIAKRIKASTNLPVSIDFEGGYSQKPEQIIENLKKLIKIGIVGVNLEDSVITNERSLDSADNFANKLSTIKKELGEQLFINARIDTYILNVPNTLEETIMRIQKYEQAGADCIFVPFLTDEESIEKICKSTNLPVNVLCMPNSPDFEKLASLGVSRISTANIVQSKLQADLENNFTKVMNDKHTKTLFG